MYICIPEIFVDHRRIPSYVTLFVCGTHLLYSVLFDNRRPVVLTVDSDVLLMSFSEICGPMTPPAVIFFWKHCSLLDIMWIDIASYLTILFVSGFHFSMKIRISCQFLLNPFSKSSISFGKTEWLNGNLYDGCNFNKKVLINCHCAEVIIGRP